MLLDAAELEKKKTKINLHFPKLSHIIVIYEIDCFIIFDQLDIVIKYDLSLSSLSWYVNLYRNLPTNLQ